jgi:hypothetical protein
MPRSKKPLCTQTQPYFTRQPVQWNLPDYVNTIHDRYSTRPNPQRSIHGAWKAALERILSCRNSHKGHRERQLRATTLLKEYHQKVRLMHFFSSLAFRGLASSTETRGHLCWLSASTHGSGLYVVSSNDIPFPLSANTGGTSRWAESVNVAPMGYGNFSCYCHLICVAISRVIDSIHRVPRTTKIVALRPSELGNRKMPRPCLSARWLLTPLTVTQPS